MYGLILLEHILGFPVNTLHFTFQGRVFMGMQDTALLFPQVHAHLIEGAYIIYHYHCSMDSCKFGSIGKVGL